VVNPDVRKIYTKRKQHEAARKDATPSTSVAIEPKYPSDGWSTNLTRMPFFKRAEMNEHISNSGKNISSGSSSHFVPTSVRKATTFLQDEYLKGILAASDDNCFYFMSSCHHSFRKHNPPHNLKVTLCIVSGKVKHAYCTCVAGSVGFCSHVFALMMKICKFTLYECKNVNDLDNEGDMQAKQSCTSMLQQWHRKGRGDTIAPQPVMEVVVYKMHQDQDRSSSKDQGVRCLLYEARTIKAIKGQQADENKLLAKLQAINKKMALAQIMTPTSESTPLVETKFGKSPQGSFGSYQLSTTEDNFKVYCDISSVPRRDPVCNQSERLTAFPRFPLKSGEPFVLPAGITEAEKTLLDCPVFRLMLIKLMKLKGKHRGNLTVKSGEMRENFDLQHQTLG